MNMGFLHKFYIIFIISIQFLDLDGRVYNVSTYGGYPNDNNDDTSAVQHAINAAIYNGANNVVQFQAGTYDLTSTLSIYAANGLTVMGQCTQQTLLLVHSQIALFTVTSSQQVTFISFAIDFMPLPFTAGYVVNVQSSYLDVQVVSPQLADVGLTVGAILRYDTTLMRPAIGPRTYEIYQTAPSNVYTSLVSSGVLRIPLASPTSFAIGDAIIARYTFTTHAIVGQDVTGFTLQSITIYTAWYMGLYTTRTRGMNVLDYHVKPRNGRWMSTSADCMHFGDSRNYINIFDSSCEAQGDDGLNVQAFIFVITQVLSSTSVIIQENSWPDTLNVGVGTNLEFSHNSTPFTAYATAAVASSAVYNSNSQVFTFTSSINASVGDRVCVSDTPTLIIRNLTVANNRGRGVLLETRNIQVTQSLFNATSSPAILFQPSLYWYEGPAARNVLLSQNVFINCNEGLYQTNGVVALLPYPVQVVPVIFNVQVTSSTFYMGPYSGNMIQCSNGASVSISGNYLATSNSTPPVIICNSQNISAYNNTISNNQSVISQYFSYDSTNPCLTSLSSGINIPASAFNSSFSPPVTAAIYGVEPSVYQTYTCTSPTGSTSSTVLHLFVWDRAIRFIWLPCWTLLFCLHMTVYY
jgi:hypothetical protein